MDRYIQGIYMHCLRCANMILGKAKLTWSLYLQAKSKRKSFDHLLEPRLNRENVGPLLNREGDLITADTDGAEGFNACFA